MRPIYETSQDVCREAEVAARIATRWRAKAKKLPARYVLDFALLRGSDLVALVEIKVRSTPMHRYPTFMLSLAKLITAREVARAARVPGFVVVQWADALAFVPVDSEPAFISVGGRNDRNDSDDTELVVHFPVHQFRVVECAREAA